MLLWILAAVAAVQYQLAVQDGNELVQIGNAIVDGLDIEWKPSAVVETSGTPACLGIIRDNKEFECHTLFEGKCDKITAREALGGEIRFEPRADEFGNTSAIVWGPRSSPVPRPLLKAPVKEGEKTEIEPEKGFFQKYWYIIVPVGLILLTAPSSG